MVFIKYIVFTQPYNIKSFFGIKLFFFIIIIIPISNLFIFFIYNFFFFLLFNNFFFYLFSINTNFNNLNKNKVISNEILKKLYHLFYNFFI